MSSVPVRASNPIGIVNFWNAIVHIGKHLIPDFDWGWIEDYREIKPLGQSPTKSRWEDIQGSIDGTTINPWSEFLMMVRILIKSPLESSSLTSDIQKVSSLCPNALAKKYERYGGVVYVVHFMKYNLLIQQAINVYLQCNEMISFSSSVIKPFQWDDLIQQDDPSLLYDNKKRLIHFHTVEIDQYFSSKNTLLNHSKYNFYRFRDSDIIESMGIINTTYNAIDIENIPIEDQHFFTPLQLSHIGSTKQEEVRKIVREAQGKNNKKKI